MPFFFSYPQRENFVGGGAIFVFAQSGKNFKATHKELNAEGLKQRTNEMHYCGGAKQHGQ